VQVFGEGRKRFMGVTSEIATVREEGNAVQECVEEKAKSRSLIDR